MVVSINSPVIEKSENVVIGNNNIIIFDTSSRPFRKVLAEVLADKDSWEYDDGPGGLRLYNLDTPDIVFVEIASNNCEEFQDFFLKNLPAKSWKIILQPMYKNQPYGKHLIGIYVDDGLSLMIAPRRWCSSEDKEPQETWVSYYSIEGSLEYEVNRILQEIRSQDYHVQLFNFPVFKSEQDAADCFEKDIQSGQNKYGYFVVKEEAVKYKRPRRE
jgi:hypothetical protein